jgi:hypothetical protein
MLRASREAYVVRRYTLSQIRSKLRQAEQKTRQAVNKYNQEVRRDNQTRKYAVNKHNQAVRAHNARVRANHQRIKNELTRLSRQPAVRITTRTVVYRTSVEALHSSYARLDQYADTHALNERYNRVLDLSERETANSLVVTKILEIKAPDADVFAELPGCERTERGNATRRSKVKYFLHRQGMVLDALEDFVEQDMENIVQLFEVFNTVTHGSAGTFDMPQLKAIRKRVEDGIMFH